MKRIAFKTPSSLLWLTLGAVGAGCAPTDSNTTETSTSALTSAQQDILGFEDPKLWSSPAGPVTTSSDDRTQGQKSLAVTPKGYVPYASSKIASLGPVSQVLSYDLKLPALQANPRWFGASQVFVSIPSRGVYNAFVGQVELTGLPVETWRR